MTDTAQSSGTAETRASAPPHRKAPHRGEWCGAWSRHGPPISLNPGDPFAVLIKPPSFNALIPAGFPMDKRNRVAAAIRGNWGEWDKLSDGQKAPFLDMADRAIGAGKMKFFRWITDRLRDLFYGPGNTYLDLGRVVGFIAAVTMVGSAAWNMHLGKEIALAELGGGLAAVVGAIAGLIAAKDIARRKALSK